MECNVLDNHNNNYYYDYPHVCSHNVLVQYVNKHVVVSFFMTGQNAELFCSDMKNGRVIL